MAKKGKKKRKRRRVDMAAVKRKAEQLASRFWKAATGKNSIRILPPWNDEGVFYFEYALHYGFKVKGRTRAFPCLKAMGGDECPVCDAHAVFQNSPNDAELANRIRPTTKYYMNILDRKRKLVYIWGVSTRMLRTILGYMNDPDWGDITDPEEGHDIVVEREGTGLESSYDLRVRPRPSPIKLRGWEDKMYALDIEIPEAISFEKLQEIVMDNYGAALAEIEDLEDEDEEDEDTEEDDDEDDDDDDDEEDDDDDDEEEDDDEVPF